MIGAPVFIDRIGKVYGSQTAVGAVTLDVPAGEFLSILGPSGSGKTTLLTMIAGFESPSAGRIIIDGRDVTAVSPDRRNIGMVFQRYALFPHLTVAENIAFPLKMRGIRKDLRAERVGRALDLVQLPDYAKRYPHELSGGQQQRVAVARAIVFEPPVLLMDEPLGALDKKLRESMQIEIKQLQRRLGATVKALDTARNVSAQCGEMTVEVQGRSRNIGWDTKGGGTRKSESVNFQRRPLIMPHEITQSMRKDEQIIIVQGHSPIRCGRAIYFRRKDMDSQAKANRFVRS
ncbi:ABC transporter ATP-binding protein [Rhizobium acaciae]|uniref:ABC transporter ATP-binding protein n=1 Tax=Rhizobium acaciae TaxID=2989736 RepID=UPI003872B226